MLKKVLIMIGVVLFSVFWWLGFMKVMEKGNPPPDVVNEAMGFPGR